MSAAFYQSLHMRIYIPKKIIVTKIIGCTPGNSPAVRRADRDWNQTAQNFFEILLAIGQSGSAALPLPRVPPFLLYTLSLFCVYIFHA